MGTNPAGKVSDYSHSSNVQQDLSLFRLVGNYRFENSFSSCVYLSFFLEEHLFAEIIDISIGNIAAYETDERYARVRH